jgi:hypothetical protein
MARVALVSVKEAELGSLHMRIDIEKLAFKLL